MYVCVWNTSALNIYVIVKCKNNTKLYFVISDTFDKLTNCWTKVNTQSTKKKIPKMKTRLEYTYTCIHSHTHIHSHMLCDKLYDEYNENCL